ncbi:MAG: hypothetical protein U9O78_05205 [Patescibacteria group bacterium]|nr:hypothetical protein [Patescibacteria group bacterium]
MKSRDYYTVIYVGPFGFIKPWTAVRDTLTYSQQFLTQSIIEGIRQKLQVEEILRHKLSFLNYSRQQEQTRPKLIKKPGHNFSIITRGALINPQLTLAFSSKKDALIAYKQHICLCRNEDVLFADKKKKVKKVSEEKFDKIEGFELLFTDKKSDLMVGYNRFDDFAPMYGQLEISDNAIRESVL